MIQAIQVEGFRGIRRLEVDGFARVNLIIGKNDCGKTALLESLAIAGDADDAAHAILWRQQERLPDTPVRDYDRFWLPLFRNQNAEQGFTLTARLAGSRSTTVQLHKAKATSVVIDEDTDESAPARPRWSIDMRVVKDGHRRDEKIHSVSSGLKLPARIADFAATWSRPGAHIGDLEIRNFSRLKQAGHEAQLLDLLREIDTEVSGVDLLAPSGTQAELFVRLGRDVPLLPIAMMGDGFRRCFEMGLTVAADQGWAYFIDEFDNGLHHSILEPVWRWVATISRKRDLQIFATTHSEECIQAACRAFAALDDDGFRVIRLDRRGDHTAATVYDRTLVEAAGRMDVEIRG
ncbi:AAA family ATPase [Sorangium sp. So ce131]|uniref:AAA family ATPase n=1 Tax=Sorangium sp. So ce131 TaxID=3133282 RepID=UPI003F5E1BA0